MRSPAPPAARCSEAPSRLDDQRRLRAQPRQRRGGLGHPGTVAEPDPLGLSAALHQETEAARQPAHAAPEDLRRDVIRAQGPAVPGEQMKGWGAILASRPRDAEVAVA